MKPCANVFTKKLAIIVTAWLGGQSFSPALGATLRAKEKPLHLAELAPLRGTMGQISLRGEVAPLPGLGVAVAFERSAVASPERTDFEDTTTAYGVEAVIYPFGVWEWPLFLASGLRYEHTIVGREALRDTLTWAPIRAEDSTDTWRNIEKHFATTQSVGWRILGAGALTAALRLERDEVLLTTTGIARDDVRSEGAMLGGRGRSPVVVRLSLHAGVYLP